MQEEGDKLKEPVNNDTAVQFFKRAGNVTVNTIPYNIGSLYNSASTWTNLGNASTASSTLTNILNGIANNMKIILQMKIMLTLQKPVRIIWMITGIILVELVRLIDKDLKVVLRELKRWGQLYCQHENYP